MMRQLSKVIFLLSLITLVILVIYNPMSTTDYNDSAIVSLTSSDTQLVGGGSFGEIIVVDDDSKFEIKQTPGHNLITAVEIDEFNNLVYAVSEYGYITVFDLSTQSVKNRIDLDTKISEVEVFNETAIVITHQQNISFINYPDQPDNQTLLSTSFGELRSQSLLDIVACVNCELDDIEFNTDTNQLLVTYFDSVYYIDPDSMQITDRDALTDGSSNNPLEIVVIGDRSIVAEIGGYNWKYLGEETRRSTSPISDIDYFNGRVVITSENKVMTPSNSHSITYENELDQIAVFNKKLYISNTKTDQLYQADDFPRRWFDSQVWYPVVRNTVITILLISFIIMSITSFYYFKHVHLHLRKLKKEAKQQGYVSLSAYEAARQKGHFDKQLEDIITEIGYSRFIDYVRSTMSKSYDMENTELETAFPTLSKTEKLWNWVLKQRSNRVVIFFVTTKNKIAGIIKRIRLWFETSIIGIVSNHYQLITVTVLFAVVLGTIVMVSAPLPFSVTSWVMIGVVVLSALIMCIAYIFRSVGDLSKNHITLFGLVMIFCIVLTSFSTTPGNIMISDDTINLTHEGPESTIHTSTAIYTYDKEKLRKVTDFIPNMLSIELHGNSVYQYNSSGAVFENGQFITLLNASSSSFQFVYKTGDNYIAKVSTGLFTFNSSGYPIEMLSGIPIDEGMYCGNCIPTYADYVEETNRFRMIFQSGNIIEVPIDNPGNYVVKHLGVSNIVYVEPLLSWGSNSFITYTTSSIYFSHNQGIFNSISVDSTIVSIDYHAGTLAIIDENNEYFIYSIPLTVIDHSVKLVPNQTYQLPVNMIISDLMLVNPNTVLLQTISGGLDTLSIIHHDNMIQLSAVLIYFNPEYMVTILLIVLLVVGIGLQRTVRRMRRDH